MGILVHRCAVHVILPPGLTGLLQKGLGVPAVCEAIGALACVSIGARRSNNLPVLWRHGYRLLSGLARVGVCASEKERSQIREKWSEG